MSEFRQHNALLLLVFSLSVGVADLADLVGLEEENLAKTLVGVNPGWQWRGVGDFEGHKPLPFRLKRSDIHDDAATRVGRFADTNRQDIPGDLEVFDGAGEGKGVRRDQHGFALDRNKRALVKVFRVNDGAVDIGKDLELVGDPKVIAVGRKPIGNYPFADLFFTERLDHAVLQSLLTDPTITLDGHCSPRRGTGMTAPGFRRLNAIAELCV